MKIILLLRSYERPLYLKKTLESLMKSDINLCMKRYIYDDGSKNRNVLELLNDDNLVNKKDKEFEIIRGKNLGCKKSYIEALKYIKNDNSDSCDYFICTIDNDVIVKSDFITKLYNNYEKAYNIFKTTNILLTGFNPTNAHLNKIKQYDGFYRKETAGAINFFFYIKFLDFLIKGWDKGFMDHGVNELMKRNNYPLLCLNKGVINHIGRFGLWSNQNNFDFDSKFK